MEYDLELDKVAGIIQKDKAKLVVIQLPDGLKPKADIIQHTIEEMTNARVLIWAGSCYGACDVPTNLDRLGVDLLVQWGHAKWQ